jgi:hypothetical protein
MNIEFQLNKMSFMVCIISLMLLTNNLQGQDKYEKESRIDVKEVPAKALKQVEILFGQESNLKWFIEESDKGTSYEAKLKYNGLRHSVEFSEEGTLQDIEIESGWKDLNAEAKENIEEYFEDNYQKTKVKRMQIQLSGDFEDILEALEEKDYTEADVRYEIEYLGTKNNRSQLWEGLFDDEGEHLQSKKIILPPTVNLDF